MPLQKSAVDKITALQEKLKAAKAEAKVAEEKRFALLGKAIADLMSDDPEFQAVVAAKLKTVSNPKDQANLALFLVPANSKSGSE